MTGKSPSPQTGVVQGGQTGVAANAVTATIHCGYTAPVTVTILGAFIGWITIADAAVIHRL